MSHTNAYPDSEIPLPRLRSISQLWTCAAALGCVGVAALAVDMPLANWIRAGNCPGPIEILCNLSEVFCHGLGVVMLVVTIAVLDPWHRYAIPRILAASLGSGLIANMLKLLVGRFRPLHHDLHGGGLETFTSWLPLVGNGSWEQSFPSSHTATAAGLAIVLVYFYPRGRWLFPALAACAGFQRVTDQYHFLSDVFWGAAVGCIFAPLCVYGSRLSRAFDRLEERILARTAAGATSRAARRRPDTGPLTPTLPDASRAA
jgi:membrane-associated phospholipid phosphatase